MIALPLIPVEPGMITMKVAEGRFGIDQRQIRRLITLRKIPSARDGYTILVRPADLRKATALTGDWVSGSKLQRSTCLCAAMPDHSGTPNV
jgi:hypothetical protein